MTDDCKRGILRLFVGRDQDAPDSWLDAQQAQIVWRDDVRNQVFRPASELRGDAGGNVGGDVLWGPMQPTHTRRCETALVDGLMHRPENAL